MIKNDFISEIISYEFTIFYFALFKPKILQSSIVFINKKNNIYLVLIGLIIFETLIAHFILYKNDLNVIAWILTLISGYFALFLVAHYKALTNRVSFLDNDKIKLYGGIFCSTEINWNEILMIKEQEFEKTKQNFCLNLFEDLEEINIQLIANTEFSIKLPYGKIKKAKSITFFCSEKEKLITLKKEQSKTDDTIFNQKTVLLL